MRLVMARARERGYRSMRLLAAKSDAVTNRMYAKAGFRRVGETRMYDHDFVCYEADLCAEE